MACPVCGDEHAMLQGGEGLVIEQGRTPMADDFEVTEPIHVNADRTKVVPEDSPEAAFLLAVPGDRIPHDQAEKLGLLKSGDAGPESPDTGGPGAGAETPRRAATNDKAVPGPKE